MRTKRYESAEKLRRDHVSDPVRALLDDTRSALAAAETAGERRAIIDAANDAAGTMDMDAAGVDRFTNEFARLIDPNTQPGPYRLWDDQHEAMVSIDDLAAERPELAAVVEAVRTAPTAHDAFEALRGAYGSGVEWSQLEYGLLEGLREFEVVDDGTVSADVASPASEPEPVEAEQHTPRIYQMIEDSIAAAEAAEPAAVTG
jgi:hypothetical protein